MAYNGAGSFSRLYSWATDKTNTVAVTAARMDAEHDGFATGLSTAICKDGQTTTTAVIPFAAGIRASDGASATPSIAFSSDTDSGLYRVSANVWAVVVGGTKVIEFGTATISCAVALSVGGSFPVASGGTGVATTNSVRATNATDDSVVDNTPTAIEFDTDTHDTNTMHDTGSNTTRLTAIVAGTYVICGSVTFAGGATGTYRTAAIKLNGLTYLAKAGRIVTTGVESLSVTAIAQLAANDYVELEAFQNSGTSLAINFTSEPIFLSMVRVSA